MTKLEIGKEYKVDDKLSVTYLGDYANKGIFMRKTKFMPYVSWHYQLNDNGEIDLYGGEYFHDLAEIYTKPITTITELRDLIVENFTNENGSVDISGLDFSDFDGNIDISCMNVKGDLIQNWQVVDGDLYQDTHIAKGKIYQDKEEENTIRKVHITYKMIRGKSDNEVAETCIDLPISQERYDELAAGLRSDSEVWRNVRDALLNLTYLQGYKKLGAWSIELEIVED